MSDHHSMTNSDTACRGSVNRIVPWLVSDDAGVDGVLGEG
jgi:hypothetical protein